MSRVCEKLRDPELADKIILGPAGKPEDKKRWIPPACMYLPRLKLY
jgi:hypothetical protein